MHALQSEPLPGSARRRYAGRMAKKRTAAKTRAAGTELLVGDVLLWKTPFGGVATWVFGMTPQGGGTYPLLEVLDFRGDRFPEDGRHLRAAKNPHAIAGIGSGELWFTALELPERVDARGEYTVVRSGFQRGDWAPSHASQYGLGGAIVRRDQLSQAIAGYAESKTDARIEEIHRAASKGRAIAEKRAALRAEAAKHPALSRDVAQVSMKPLPAALNARELVLSLTGRESHRLYWARGVGNMYVGPNAQGARTPQAIVSANASLNWWALDAVPPAGAGYAMPRWLRYEGNDAGIFTWLAMRDRVLERLELWPSGDLTADASDANLHDFWLRKAEAAQVSLVLPAGGPLRVDGSTQGLVLNAAEKGERVRLTLDLGTGTEAVPFWPGLAGLRMLDVRAHGAALHTLAQYTQLLHLSLTGPAANLAPLGELQTLEYLSLTELWDLASLPPVKTWPALKELWLTEVRTADAEAIAKEAKALQKTRALKFTARNVRSDAWLANRPRFEHWSVPPRGLKAANTAYATARDALGAVKKPTPKHKRVIAEAFIDALNAVHAKTPLFTLEREEAAAAVCDLVGEEALEWFDARRAF